MANPCIYEEPVQLLGNPVILKISQSSTSDILVVSGVSVDGEVRYLFDYRRDVDAVQPNKREINDLVDEYERRTGIVLKVLITISDSVVWLVNWFMQLVTGIFGGMTGFGLIGIAMMLIILFSILFMWIYALFIIVPLTAISYGTRLWLEKNKEKAIRQLSRDAVEVARRSTVLDGEFYHQLPADDTESAAG